MNCRAELSGGVLVLENGLIRREFLWNEGNLASRLILDKRNGHRWELAGTAPDCVFPGEEAAPSEATFRVEERAATAVAPEHLRAEVVLRLGSLETRRSFRVYPDCPAIACDYFLRGKAGAAWRGAVAETGSLANIEDLVAKSQGRPVAPVIERLIMSLANAHHTGRRHLRLRCVRFFDITDRRNNLVDSRDIVPYVQPTCPQGNLLLGLDLLRGAGFFMLKEAPCPEAQIAYPGCDFVCTDAEISVVGVGAAPGDLDERDWTRCYGFATGVAGGTEEELLFALRAYQSNLRVRKSGRDNMIMLNTWGDRSRDAKISEAFTLAELEAAARLGITHFQLDSGWQKGASPHSVAPGGTFEGIWERGDYWDVHPERFPNDLFPVIERGKELGIELCLWFNPSPDESYAHWVDDAGRLIEINKRYGIRTFKIDGVDIPDKRAELNVRAMLDRVMEATGGETVFNLDMTAGRRFGYHYFREYGNIFLENRYTDWSNYYPHWTLRNLWMLSRYVPPQNLQVEFLNKWRNAEKYPAEDPLAPGRVPFEYCFAVTMMGQPLAWFEASELPEEAFGVGKTIKAYRAHQENIHGGRIFPIGEEPQGTSWTGFQSCDGDRGYFAVYRELNDRDRARLRTWGLAGREVTCSAVAGQGADFSAAARGDGGVEFRLPAPFTFALYQYRVSG